MKIFTLLLLFTLASCKGTRFYWETKFSIPNLSSEDRHLLNEHFKLTGDMSTWHPTFGKYCSSLKSNTANLFVCFKGQEVRIVSSYPGILKGDKPTRISPSTVKKYLESIKNEPGYREHRQIEDYVRTKFEVKNEAVRLLMYGEGSLILKDELSD